MIVTNKETQHIFAQKSIIDELQIKYDTDNIIIFEYIPKIRLPAFKWIQDFNFWLYTSKKIKINNRKIKIIINIYWEAPSGFLINKMIGDKKDILVIDCGAEPVNSNHIASSWWFGYYHFEKSAKLHFNLRNKHYVCLNRRPRYARVKFVNMLLTTGLVNKGIVSFLSDKTVLFGYENIEWTNMIDSKYHSLLPLEIDSCNNDTQHFMSNTMQSAFINVVTETAYEIQNHGGIPLDYDWNRILISEKTMKAIWMKQLPLFIAVFGHVNFLRKKGIDVFDDFINHSYDLIIDPNERIVAVFNELNRLCNIPLDDIRDFCKKNILRFESNIHKSLAISKIEREIMTQRVTDFLNY